MLCEFQHILDVLKKLLVPHSGNFCNMSRVAESVDVKGFRADKFKNTYVNSFFVPLLILIPCLVEPFQVSASEIVDKLPHGVVMSEELLLENHPVGTISALNVSDRFVKDISERFSGGVKLFGSFDLFGNPCSGDNSGNSSNDGRDFVHSDFLVFYLMLLNGVLCLFACFRRYF